ncbi:hypothetical protein [Chenggangzhangella methanolivorans]|uniref:Uncharacterized protein n=2 Tax=Chenggangzhangella methanolivorans TaxID=1437009 RepID=A0A9E6RH57_9HYPH|nr:hypothetical protein [Chenggangzhangella methanolivorans]QZO01371.1 hypothetical protein K6K41_07880 [Chenggangzhangella methanolivorans]
MQVAEARRQREIQPTLDALKALSEEASGDKETPEITRRRIVELSAFGQELDVWYREIKRLPIGTLRGLMRMGAKIARFIPGARADDRPKPKTDGEQS